MKSNVLKSSLAAFVFTLAIVASLAFSPALNSTDEFATKKGNLEFMPDKNTPGTYFTLYLESTSADGKGIGYKLQEETGKNLPGYYKTGNLKWRVL